MAFWGVEVKPGKPYVHQLDETRGRLHISQATLGVGASSKKSMLQCNIGDKSPVLLCCLLPDKTESCPLDLEFEEEEDVIFSVLGPRSVHLGGYYLGSSCAHGHGDGDESDSYGEDIGESENELSTDFDSEDEYEDDFIDDDEDDIEMFSASPRPKSGVVIEEILDDETPVNGNGDRKRPKSKFQVSDSDDSNQKQIIVGGASSTIESESEDEDGFPVSSPCAEVQGKLDKKVSKKSKGKAKDDGDQVMPISSPSRIEEESAEVQAKPDKKVSKKSNKKSENGGDRVTGAKRKSQDDQDGKAERVIEKTKDSSLPTSEIEQESAEQQKRKKRKERIKEGKTHGVGDDSMVEADKAKTVEITQDEPAVNGTPSNDKSDEDTTEKKKKKKKNKKNKTPESNKSADGEETKKGSVVKIEEKKAEKPTHQRNYSNGLVVEELEMGKPDGEKASPGTKVSVRYIGKLKKNGNIFDSNINRAPFQFRLGVGEVIKGWDVGVTGMRVGDKRRLTIPPSMGYGQKGAAPKIPPNAWLEFDVELLRVR
ncbi:hypothetical protein AQUCO_01300604v1 [Aquilegia coerulea]|uniref:peptidylprolyl isomerase n=1 Tax=Aquilegia coerulea TaxID=218851 RepID=A0A2G5E2L2_AQUCA|nr:hypothetical protein AQUCO_01300604v1 [Aquilegia coerulea]